ncbi:MAG: hypothetical protein H0W06_10480 [Chloroflexia bacterium]|nr:hypothetical protein [Chloroflexia bacterium]
MERWTATNISPMFWVALVALLLGVAIGRGWPGDAATASSHLQASPEAVCLPSPAASPVPLASPVAAGQPVAYGDGWTVAATSVTTMPNIKDNQPQGVFAAVFLTITNNMATARYFPYEDLVLFDDQGRPFLSASFITNQFDGSRGIHYGFPPSLPTDTAIVFDVATDVGTNFVLASSSDPTFRLQVNMELRGVVDRRSW